MQLQAQVCFWFLLSFTLGFYLVLSLLSVLFNLSFSSVFLFFLIWPQGVLSQAGQTNETRWRMFEKEMPVSLQTLDSSSHLVTKSIDLLEFSFNLTQSVQL